MVVAMYILEALRGDLYPQVSQNLETKTRARKGVNPGGKRLDFSRAKTLYSCRYMYTRIHVIIQ